MGGGVVCGEGWEEEAGISQQWSSDDGPRPRKSSNTRTSRGDSFDLVAATCADQTTATRSFLFSFRDVRNSWFAKKNSPTTYLKLTFIRC